MFSTISIAPSLSPSPAPRAKPFPPATRASAHRTAAGCVARAPEGDVAPHPATPAGTPHATAPASPPHTAAQTSPPHTATPDCSAQAFSDQTCPPHTSTPAFPARASPLPPQISPETRRWACLAPPSPLSCISAHTSSSGITSSSADSTPSRGDAISPHGPSPAAPARRAARSLKAQPSRPAPPCCSRDRPSLSLWCAPSPTGSGRGTPPATAVADSTTRASAHTEIVSSFPHLPPVLRGASTAQASQPAAARILKLPWGDAPPPPDPSPPRCRSPGRAPPPPPVFGGGLAPCPLPEPIGPKKGVGRQTCPFLGCPHNPHT